VGINDVTIWSEFAHDKIAQARASYVALWKNIFITSSIEPS